VFSADDGLNDKTVSLGMWDLAWMITSVEHDQDLHPAVAWGTGWLHRVHHLGA
jgi:hypothetical protein